MGEPVAGVMDGSGFRPEGIRGESHWITDRLVDHVVYGMRIGIGRSTAMDENMTSTAFTLEGYQIVESLGVVRGVTVRSRSLFGAIGARIETLLGGHISILTTLCERARAEARCSSAPGA